MQPPSVQHAARCVRRNRSPARQIGKLQKVPFESHVHSRVAEKCAMKAAIIVLRPWSCTSTRREDTSSDHVLLAAKMV